MSFKIFNFQIFTRKGKSHWNMIFWGIFLGGNIFYLQRFFWDFIGFIGFFIKSYDRFEFITIFWDWLDFFEFMGLFEFIVLFEFMGLFELIGYFSKSWNIFSTKFLGIMGFRFKCMGQGFKMIFFFAWFTHRRLHNSMVVWLNI